MCGSAVNTSGRFSVTSRTGAIRRSGSNRSWPPEQSFTRQPRQPMQIVGRIDQLDHTPASARAIRDHIAGRLGGCRVVEDPSGQPDPQMHIARRHCRVQLPSLSGCRGSCAGVGAGRPRPPDGRLPDFDQCSGGTACRRPFLILTAAAVAPVHVLDGRVLRGGCRVKFYTDVEIKRSPRFHGEIFAPTDGPRGTTPGLSPRRF